MRLLDDTTNRGSDADIAYQPNQNAADAFDGEGYDLPQYGAQNSPVGRTDVAKNIPDAGQDAKGKIRSAVDSIKSKAADVASEKGLKSIANKFGVNKDSVGSALKTLSDDSPENRERVKEEAKERIRKYTKDKLEDKLGKEAGKYVGKGVRQMGKEAAKDVGKNIGKNIGKQVGKQVGKEVGKEAVKLGTRAGAQAVAKGAQVGAEGIIAGAGVASAPETLGLGLLAAILLEIAMDLGLSDAVDCVFELTASANAARKMDFEAANEHRKQAKWHAQKAYTSIGAFIWLLIGLGMSLSVLGWIIGIPIILLLNVYAALGVAFPKIGWFQGMSRWWEHMILIIFDFILFVVVMTFIAGMFWWICQQSGLGTGLFATIGAKVADWWSGGTYVSTFNDICTQLGQF